MKPSVRPPRLTAPHDPVTDGPSERQQAVADWLNTGSVQLPVQKIDRIMPKEPARKAAELIEKHFVADGVDREKLTAWWSTYSGGMQYARISPAFIPFIVDGLVDHLESKGLA